VIATCGLSIGAAAGVARDDGTRERSRPADVSLPVAAVMLDLGFAPAAVKAVPILARTAGLLAHLAEERERPIGLLPAAAAEHAVEPE
jgi:citrate synthase